jgi:beta-galactosidase GanA
MTFKDFIFKLQMKQIPGIEALLACEPFVKKEFDDRGIFEFGIELLRNPATHDLGFAELSNITSKEQSIQEIVNVLWNSICDFDTAGRDVSKLRYRQLCANPCNALKRRVLKSYYLHYFDIDQEPKKDEVWGNIFDHSTESLYRMNAFK